MHFCFLLEYKQNIYYRNISKILSSKDTQNLLNHAKQSAADTFKTDSKRAVQKTAEATGGLIVRELLIKL